jgi:hypothetical protein
METVKTSVTNLDQSILDLASVQSTFAIVPDVTLELSPRLREAIRAYTPPRPEPNGGCLYQPTHKGPPHWLPGYRIWSVRQAIERRDRAWDRWERRLAWLKPLFSR